jgi:hypothetical protein
LAVSGLGICWASAWEKPTSQTSENAAVSNAKIPFFENICISSYFKLSLTAR